jgi:phospholipid/cholesterol/gamma-HCH transport system substrate-binding protein
MAGVQVGHVTDVKRTGSTARVTLDIDAKHSPLPVDSRIGVRLRTLIGENYASIYPGRSTVKLRDGGTLPLSQADDYVDVDEILSVLQGSTRESARRFIQGMGTGVKRRGPKLNAFLGGATGVAKNGVSLVDTVSRDRRQVSRLVENFGDVMRSIGDRGAAVGETARGLRGTFSAVAARDEALGETLDQMPTTLSQVRKTSAVIRSVTGTLAPTLTNLASGVRAAGPAVRLLRPASAEGEGVLKGVSATSLPLIDTLGRVRRLAGPTAAALPQVHAALCELVPTLDYVAPYGRDIASFTQNVLASAANYYDATGHALRLGVSLAENAFMATSKEVRDAEQKLLATGLVGKIHMLGYDPYPGPGNTGNLEKGRGIVGPDQWHYKYERVQAAC